MTTPLVNYKDVTDSEVQLYNDLGYLMLPGFLNATFLESLKEEALSNLEHSGITRESLYNATTTGDKLRQCSKYLAGSELDRLINSPRTLNVASRLIGGKACRYLPFTAVKSAGGGEFHLHDGVAFASDVEAEAEASGVSKTLWCVATGRQVLDLGKT